MIGLVDWWIGGDFNPDVTSLHPFFLHGLTPFHRLKFIYVIDRSIDQLVSINELREIKLFIP